MTKRREIIAKLLLLITTIIWGSSFFILKNTLDSLPTFFVLAMRFSLGAVIIGLVFVKKLIKLNKKALLHGIILGAVLAAAYALQTMGLKYTTPGKNAFLTTTYVIIVPFMGWAFFKSRPKINNLIAAILCLVGIGLVSLSGGFHVEPGDILTLCCGIFYALQIIFIKKFASDDDAGQLLFIELLTTAIVFWIISLASEKASFRFSGEQWLPILYLGLVATGATQLMQMVGQKYSSPSGASLILSLEAVFGVAFSMIFYKERLTLQLGMGFAVIFIAVLISELNWAEIWSTIKRKKNKSGEVER